MDEDDEGMNADGLRPNALYLRGSPITHLPTNNIFAYARHFNMEPVGLEWIDDQSCVLVFPTNAACRAAVEAFRKSPKEQPDFDDCVSAKPIPLILWPAEDRINKTLGMAEGLEGPLSMRVARTNDRKIRGAKQRSAFYQKHGMDAGKDPNAHAIGRAPENDLATKRRRVHEEDDEEKRRQLDEELDDFLRAEDRIPSPPPSPPSKMRSDYMTNDGHEIGRISGLSLLDRTSLIREHFSDEERGERPYLRNGRRQDQRGGRGRRRKEWGENISVPPLSRRRINENDAGLASRSERPKKTLQELDDELDAFLHGN
ncbi:uncharacterized protein FOMMEDRAFT_21345, partial [Fomitiporia mediterranea MF3/22]|uniref:uncharacterized protein n=1 Tax=Fomitiporia mediterranea (strain MF3/22) TaxID=694068 RepID=UPI00044078C7